MKKVNFKKYLFSSSSIFIYYFLLACFWTRPVIFHLRSMVIGYHDTWQFIWNFWWLKTALETGQNPFFTHYLHWPNGISLLFHTLNLPNAIISILFQTIIGLPATYNLLILLNLALTGFGTYLLTNYFSKNKFAGFLAGYVVAFSAYMMAHSLGHLNLVSFGWVPLFILYYWKMIHEESPWYFASLFLILIAFTDWYYFFFTGIFIFLHLIYSFFFQRHILFSKKTLANFGLMILVSLIFIAPYLGSMIYEKITNKDFSFLGHNPILNSLDFQALFVPNFTSLFNNSYRLIWGRFQSGFEGVGYLGFSVLAMALSALIFVRKKETYFFFFVFILFLILSFGPFFQFKGIVYKNIPLLYFWLDKNVSFIALQGVPARFISFSYLSLAVIVSLMVSKILQLKHWWKYPLIGFVSFAIFFEYLPSKIITSRISKPEFYSKIGKDSNEYAIIDLSYDFDKVLYYQTIHHKSLISGYTSRGTQKTIDFLNNTPVVNNIYYSKNFEDNFDPKASVEVLKRLKIKYILISNQDKIRLKIVNQLDMAVVDKNFRGVVYKVY